MSLCAMVVTAFLLVLPSTINFDYTNEMMTHDRAFAQNQTAGNTSMTSAADNPGVPANRTFYLENSAIPNLNQTKLGIPPDVFSLPQMTLEQGDNAIIHF
jgi:hypothetical protein